MKKVVIVFCTGALIAGVGGYFVYRWRKNKMMKQDDEPIEVERITYDKFKDIYSKKHDEIKPVVRDDDDEVTKQTDIRKEKFAKQVNMYMQTDGEKENFEAYLAGMESPDEDDSDDEDNEDEDDDDISDEKSHRKSPYEITAGEFCNNRTYYDKVSVNYFGEDRVVADDRDEIMENAYRVLGDLNLAFSAPRAPSVVYIRNEDLEVDYEVSYVDGSYRKEVLHLDKED